MTGVAFKIATLLRQKELHDSTGVKACPISLKPGNSLRNGVQGYGGPPGRTGAGTAEMNATLHF
jgi:hypothetical protein